MRILKPTLLTLLALIVTVRAQDPRGTFAGRITDSTGAVLPGVEVRVTKTDTDVTATAVSNDAGLFTVPFLLPGLYRVSAELPGFDLHRAATVPPHRGRVRQEVEQVLDGITPAADGQAFQDFGDEDEEHDH